MKKTGKKQKGITREETDKKLSDLDEKLKKQKKAIQEMLKRLNKQETKEK
jgi:hypothetical protein